jgi:hypothetical protein
MERGRPVVTEPPHRLFFRGSLLIEIEFHLFFRSKPIIRLLFSRLAADLGNENANSSFG